MSKEKRDKKNIEKNIGFTGKMKIYMQWSVWMTLLLVLATIGIFTISIKAGFLMIVVTMVYFAIAWMLCIGAQKDIFGELVNFATQYGQVQKKILHSLYVK